MVYKGKFMIDHVLDCFNERIMHGFLKQQLYHFMIELPDMLQRGFFRRRNPIKASA